MEPRFMGQLPELMKNYKAEETEIIAGLQEKLQEVFQKAQQMQKVDRKGKICTMGVSYLQSSVLTGSYDLRIDLYDKEFYLDSAECCTYWKPAFITEYIQKDIKYFKYNIHGKVPQIRTYEIQEFMDGYIINYLYLLAQFLEQIMPQILCKVRPAFREVMDISRIKDHVFSNEHILDAGVKRFDADPEIADAWYRLTNGTYNQNDIDLLNHEYFESKFESFYKTDYRTAHNKTEESGRIWDPYKENN